jgi:hypothetical protein
MADEEKTSKQPFVSQSDRPEVRLKADTPLSELRVRDLASLLGQVGGTGKDFWDGKSWQKDDFDGTIKGAKEIKEDKEVKESKDVKEVKEVKDKEKEKEKREKLEKPESKELKVEKIELDGVFEGGARPGPDPRLDQVVQALSGLTSQVAQLADQVEELKKARDS